MDLCKSQTIIYGCLAWYGLGLFGCLTTDFNEHADGVFFCTSTDQCNEGQKCVLERCDNDDGPQLIIKEPEPLARVSFAPAIDLTVQIGGSGLALVTPDSADLDGSGYIEVYLDGEKLARLTQGTVAEGVLLRQTLESLSPGVHYLEARSFRANGVPYQQPSATAHTHFWIDDGSPQIALLSPRPDQPHLLGRALDVEIAVLNYDFIRPEFDDASTTPGLGHAHIYLGQDDYPDCLPACNGNYEVSVYPDGSELVRRMSGTVPQTPAMQTPLRVTTSLNFSGHFPVPSQSLDPDDPFWTDESNLDSLVNHSVTIQLVNHMVD